MRNVILIPDLLFDANLRRFVKETRAKGGIPVLFNAIVRRNFRNNKNAVAEDDVRKDLSKGSVSQDGEVLIDTHGKYLESPRNVAKELDVPFVDMNKITHDLVQEMGPEGFKKNCSCGFLKVCVQLVRKGVRIIRT